MERNKEPPSSRDTSANQTEPKQHDDINRYRKEIKQLRGKIQGYQTLSRLLQESKSEIKELKANNAELKNRLEAFTSQSAPSSLLHGLSSSHSLNSLTEEKRLATGEGPQKPSENQQTTKQLTQRSGHASVASENSELDEMEVVTQQDITEPQLASTAGEIAQSINPSLEIDPYDLLQSPPSGGQQALPSGGPQDPFSLQNLANVRPASSRASTAGQSDLSESIVLISPESPTAEALQGQLVSQVQQISEVLMRNVGLHSPSELSDALARLAIDVLKVEKELKMKQLMINNLCPENEQLKTRLEATIRAREENIRQLKKEKRELQEKLARLEKKLSPKSPEAGATQEWVHVQDPQVSAQVTAVNERWEKQIRDLEDLHNTEVTQLQAHLDNAKQRIRNAEATICKQREDSDKIVQMAKLQAIEERESTIQRLHQEQERRHECETELISARHQLSTLQDQITALETQLSIFQDQQYTSNNLSPEDALSSLAAMSPDELRTQIQILRQQACIYKEDFNRERQDRERMQADKDVIKTALERYKTDMTASQRKVRQVEQERDLLKSENACLRQEFQQIRQSEQDAVRLQSENVQLRQQLQQKIDEIRRLTSASGTSASQRPAPCVPPPDRTLLGGETWRCTACTFDNPAVRSSCEVCGRSRNRTSRSPTPSRQARHLIPHSGPQFGWTECDTPAPPTGRVTSGDDLIIDQGEDIPDASRN